MPSNGALIIIGLLALIIFIRVAQEWMSSGKSLKDFPYKLRDNFLSPAELSFYKVLENVVGSRAVIVTKVNLADVFWVQSKNRSYHRSYTNKIDRKHVDFLLCDSTTMQPILGIELDDKSHKRKDRQERDAFVDGVFDAAGLPLIHIPVGCEE